MLSVELIQCSVAIAIVAYVYSVILTDRGMLLSRVSAWISKLCHPKTRMLKTMYPAAWQEYLDKPLIVGGKRVMDYTWLYKMLIGCERCVSGQMALWWYLFTQNYDLMEHIVFIALTIFITHTITVLWAKLN
jgi:hypothetical protein